MFENAVVEILDGPYTGEIGTIVSIFPTRALVELADSSGSSLALVELPYGWLRLVDRQSGGRGRTVPARQKWRLTKRRRSVTRSPR